MQNVMNRMFGFINSNIKRLERLLRPGELQRSYYVMSRSPLILMVWMARYPNLQLNPFNRFLKDKKVFFLVTPTWNIDDPGVINRYVKYEKKMRRHFPLHEMHVLCPSIGTLGSFSKAGLKCTLCSHNAFVEDDIYTVNTRIKKKYDAVYVARFESYKRHYLASMIPNCAFVGAPTVKEGKRVEREILKSLKDRVVLTHDEDGNFVKLKRKEVAEVCNQARVGLCLSREEGAMYASIEYLLCGIPVVSTKSKGGRDAFFDEEYTEIVDDDPRAVRDGCYELIEKNISPEYVRAKTLEKVQVHRKNLIDLVQDIYSREKVDRSFADEWDKVFHNRFVKREKIRVIKEKLCNFDFFPDDV